jgi:hypothetical protein
MLQAKPSALQAQLHALWSQARSLKHHDSPHQLSNLQDVTLLLQAYRSQRLREG